MLFPLQRRLGEAPRVVVTGGGIITALGLGWPANEEGFRLGRTAFRPLTLFDVSRQRTKLAAQLELPANLPATRLNAKISGRLDRASKMLILAAHEAWSQSGWTEMENLPIVLGTTSGSMTQGENYYRTAITQPGRQRGQPTRGILYLAHMQAQYLAEALGIHGNIVLIANACASGSNAIGHAWEMIRSGRAERVLTGGYDALNLLVFSGFDSLQALSPTTCRPFDTRRDGLALGEGAAVLTLETLASAQARKAVILGEILAYSSAMDLHHLTQPHPAGEAALASMTQACQLAGVTPWEVGYVNAHGTGTVLNDGAEAQAINRWAGDRAPTLPVSSTKANIGHLLGGAGAVEAAVCLMALRGQWLPPQTHIQEVDPVCQFPIVRAPARTRFDVALSNSFGFGGVNATLVLRRWA